jgi:hypothetical protein
MVPSAAPTEVESRSESDLEGDLFRVHSDEEARERAGEEEIV